MIKFKPLPRTKSWLGFTLRLVANTTGNPKYGGLWRYISGSANTQHRVVWIRYLSDQPPESRWMAKMRVAHWELASACHRTEWGACVFVERMLRRQFKMLYPMMLAISKPPKNKKVLARKPNKASK